MKGPTHPGGAPASRKPPSMLDAALVYAASGWPVFPLYEPVWVLEGEPVVCSCGDAGCSNVGKHPRTRRGFKEATTDEAEIRRIWEASPTANIGVPTGAASGMIVVDIDPRHGGDDSLAELEAEHGPLPHTVEQLTGGGGRHLCFAHPGFPVKNRVGLRPGIDVRGDGGYVVVEPSVHASGRRYAFELSSLPGEVEMAELPGWLLDLLGRSGGKAQGGAEQAPSPPVAEVVTEGKRNSTLTSLAGTMRRRGMSEPAIAAALVAENSARCIPPLPEAEVERIARSVARYPAVAQVAEIWEPPLPLVTSAAAPPFPIDAAFPDSLEDIRGFVAGLAREMQVPVDLPAMLLMPIVSTAISQKYVVEVRGRWRETPPIWTMTILDSGERKSPTLRRMTDPLHEWERDEAERLRPILAEEAERREIMEKERARCRREAGEGGDESGDAAERAIELARLLAEMQEQHAPSLVLTEGTSEGIVEMMLTNGERALVATPEADAFDVMMGRYSDGQPNMGIWLCGYSGDRMRVVRKGKQTSHLSRPHLSVAAAVQPEAVRGLLGNRAAKGRGLLARYGWSVPAGMVGRRVVGAPGVGEREEMAYVTSIRHLLDLPLEPDLPPRVARFSPEAMEIFTAFERGVERELGRGGGMSDQREWGAKLCGLAARYALGLHCLETVGRVSGLDVSDISVETLNAALAWTPYLIEHERVAMGVVGCDPVVGQAERVLRWLERTGLAEFSLRDCFTAVRNQAVRQTHDLGEPLRLLVEMGYLRPLPQPDRAGRAGQPPSPRYEVNPLWERGGAA